MGRWSNESEEQSMKETEEEKIASRNELEELLFDKTRRRWGTPNNSGIGNGSKKWEKEKNEIRKENQAAKGKERQEVKVSLQNAVEDDQKFNEISSSVSESGKSNRVSQEAEKEDGVSNDKQQQGSYKTTVRYRTTVRSSTVSTAAGVIQKEVDRIDLGSGDDDYYRSTHSTSPDKMTTTEGTSEDDDYKNDTSTARKTISVRSTTTTENSSEEFNELLPEIHVTFVPEKRNADSSTKATETETEANVKTGGAFFGGNSVGNRATSDLLTPPFFFALLCYAAFH
jgi:hypothetical protein